MVRKQYGTTWWGKKWLDSLTGIDHANRIPRGLSYARNGRVLDVELNPHLGKIQATVSGSHYSSYTIKLSFKRVPDNKKKAFLDDALADLSIVASLTNRELDPKLYDLALKHDILLFPRQWHDLGMHCTCPDFAVPCKHIAAVIYKLSELIDANPFLIFELVGIDLNAELKSRNIFDEMTDEVKTADFTELYRHALMRPHDLAQVASQYNFDLALEPVAAQDAQVLYLAPDLITYERSEVAFEPGSKADECAQLKKRIEVLKGQITTLESKLAETQEIADAESVNLENYRAQLQKAQKIRAASSRQAMMTFWQEKIDEIEANAKHSTQLKEELSQAQCKLSELEAKYQDLSAEIERNNDDAAQSVINTELILGYNPADLPQEPEAATPVEEEAPALSADALSELDAIDAGDDVVPDDVAPAASVTSTTPAVAEEAPKRRGRKPKAQVLAEQAAAATAATAAAVGSDGLEVHELISAHEAFIRGAESLAQECVAAKAKSRSKKKAEAAESMLRAAEERAQCAQNHLDLLKAVLAAQNITSGSLDVRRYRGSIEALERLIYVPIADIGDSIRNMFAESAPGFTQGNLRNRVFHTVEFAAKLATKQLKDTTDRDMVVFDFDGSMSNYEPRADWATRGQDPFGGEKPTADAASIAAAAGSAMARSGERSDGSSGVLSGAEQVALAQAAARRKAFDEYGHLFACAPNFSNTSLTEHGFFAHPPLFYLSTNGILEVNVPMHVITTDRYGSPQPNSLTVLPPPRQTNSYHFAGLYQMFSGFIKNTKVLLKERAEVQILYYLWFIASQLVKSRAIMPQLFVNSSHELACRWLPATCADEVKALVTQVGLALQGFEHYLFYRRDRQYYLDPQFLGELALAPFIQSYVAWSFALDPKCVSLGHHTIPELRFMFYVEGVPVVSDDIDDQGLRMRLETWVAPLSQPLGSYTPVLRFIDLSDQGNYLNTVFFELEHEIVAKARESARKMQQRIDKFERFAPSMDFLNKIKEAEPPVDDSVAGRALESADFRADYDDDYNEGGSDSVLGYNDYESFFANNRGIGIELGFVGFSQDLLNALRLAENQDAVLADQATAKATAAKAAPNSAVADPDDLDDEDFDYGEDLQPNSGVELEDSAQKVVGGMDETGFVSLCHIISHPAFEPVRQECLRTVARLTTLSSSLKEILNHDHNVAIVPLTELYDLINTAQTALRLMGVRLVLPKSLTKLEGPKTVMELEAEDNELFKNTKSFMSLNSLLHFNWRVAVGDEALTLAEFKMLLANAGNIVRFRDRFVYADPDLLMSIQHKFERLQDGIMPQGDLMEALLTGSCEGTPVLISSGVQDKLDSMLHEEPIALPEGLNATLRPYQVRGFEWLMRNSRINVGSILADDMGLGKTLQVITTLLKLKQEGVLTKERPALVVVPTSLVTNWQREVAHFAPDLSLHAYYGLVKEFGFGQFDVIVTTYGTARARLSTITEHEYSVMVIDEAQAIKTITTAVSKAMREVKADYRIAMSGTPVENRLLEYFSILDFANRGLFGSAKSFHKNFAKPIEENHDPTAVDRFKRLTAPFIMRRLKSDKAIIADLPDKLTSDQFCTLTQQQAAIYQAVVNETMTFIEQCNDPNMRRALVLKLIQQLKAICNSPAQFDASGKYQPEDSGKVERLFELLQDITDANGKALIFTQSVVMGKILQNLIEERFERKPDFLYGGLSRSERMDMVDDFQNDPSNRFLLLSLKAAGTGLNLTAANNVIHFDLWWNPAVENQATDRAYRIGQRNKVQVYRFICANTFEERINAMIQSKRDLADLTVTAGESWLGKLSDRQLNDLFSLHQD